MGKPEKGSMMESLATFQHLPVPNLRQSKGSELKFSCRTVVWAVDVPDDSQNRARIHQQTWWMRDNIGRRAFRWESLGCPEEKDRGVVQKCMDVREGMNFKDIKCRGLIRKKEKMQKQAEKIRREYSEHEIQRKVCHTFGTTGSDRLMVSNRGPSEDDLEQTEWGKGNGICVGQRDLIYVNVIVWYFKSSSRKETTKKKFMNF
jgi:hypothetical protein